MNEEKEIQEVKKQILEQKKKSIRIDRVPEQTKEAFCRLAHDRFCDDYGWTLDFLLNYNIQLENLIAEIIEIRNEIDIKNKPVEKEIKMLNGRVLKR